MSILFFDIETFIDVSNPRSGLNPLEEESKVILISFTYFKDETTISQEIIEPVILKEWEYKLNGEKRILQTFYSFLKQKVLEDTYINKEGIKRCNLTLSGYNILGFDIPFLFNRLVKNNIDTKNNIYEILINKPILIDLMQISILLSNKSHKYNKLLPSSQKTINQKLNIPVKTEEGKKISEYYINKNFDSIINYVKEEFTFNLLYLKLKSIIQNLTIKI